MICETCKTEIEIPKRDFPPLILCEKCDEETRHHFVRKSQCLSMVKHIWACDGCETERQWGCEK